MATQEPLVDLADVQGNIFPGFNKDHQSLRFLGIVDLAQARLALAALIQDVSTSAVVRDFTMVRSAIKAQRNGGPSGLTATWMNLALSASGLTKLSFPAVVDALEATAFKVGLAASSPLLGDPLDPAEPGHPNTWKLGGPNNPTIDVVVTVAGDRREDVDDYVNGLDARLARFEAPDGGPALRQVMDDLNGDTLGGALNGHEHFGFKDGISQPVILGRPAASPDDFIVPSLLDSDSPGVRQFGRPGQVLIYPGQLLLGHKRQNGQNRDRPLNPFPLPAAWMKNSSFMVLRVLAQDVPGFWQQMRSYAQQVLGRDDDDATDWVAARVVGRWPSGAPITRTPDQDDPAFVADNRVVNDFLFRQDGVPPRLRPGEPPLPQLPLSRGDPDGLICPFAGHIRKVNPRDDSVEGGSPGDTLTHLLVRRGVPYGPAFPDPRHAVADATERGLIFVSYQASIERQFQFLMQNWINGDAAPHAGGGRDGLLGRHRPQRETVATAMDIVDKAGTVHRVPQTADFITPRGGGYFLAPSIAALLALTSETVPMV